MVRRLALLSLLAISALTACGGKGAASGEDAKVDVDADPLGLLPGPALVVAGVDMHALAASTAGPTILGLADSLVPLGDDAGFEVKRDVDRLVVATYAANEVDVAGVLTGRFDVAKITAALRTKQGGAITHAPYAGFATDTVGVVTIAPLTAKTLVAGTTERVHRVLDRIAAHTLTRAFPTWVGDTLATPGTAFTVAADFVSTPVASAALGSLNVPWLRGLQVGRILGDFNPPGLNVAATLTYADAAGAQAGADGLHTIDNWQRVLAPVLLGAKLENLRIGAAQNDATCAFAVSDASLQALASLASRYVHPATP